MKLIYTCFVSWSLFLIGLHGLKTYSRQIILSTNDHQCLSDDYISGTQLFVSYKINLYDTKMKQYLNFDSPTTAGIQIDIRVHYNAIEIFHDQLMNRMEGYTGFNFEENGNYMVCVSVFEHMDYRDDIKVRTDLTFSNFDSFVEYKETRDKLAREENRTDPGPLTPDMLWQNLQSHFHRNR